MGSHYLRRYRFPSSLGRADDRRGAGLRISARRTDARRPAAATGVSSLPAGRAAGPTPITECLDVPAILPAESRGMEPGGSPLGGMKIPRGSAEPKNLRGGTLGMRRARSPASAEGGPHRSIRARLRSTPTEGNTPRISAILGTSRMPGDSRSFCVGRPRADPPSAGVVYRFERRWSSSGRFFAISSTSPTSFAGGSMRRSGVPTSVTVERRSGRPFARWSHRSRTLSCSRDAPRRRGIGLSSVVRLPDHPVGAGAVRNWHAGIHPLGGGEHRHA